jgi:hypothetical protein
MERLSGLTELFPPVMKMPPPIVPIPMAQASVASSIAVPYATASSFAESMRPLPSSSGASRPLPVLPVSVGQQALGGTSFSTSSTFAQPISAPNVYTVPEVVLGVPTGRKTKVNVKKVIKQAREEMDMGDWSS